jgi:Protein of unknown function (DUF3108)
MLITEPSTQSIPASRSKRQAGSVVLAAAFVVLAASPGTAATTFEATYAISIAGLTIAHATAETRFTETEYDAVIEGETSGLSRIVSDARATLAGRGRISGQSLYPRAYDLETREGDFETHVRMKMHAGAITDLLVIPRLLDHPDRIPIEPSHKRDVVDPVAALLIVEERGIDDGRRVCQRTIKIFDGWQRYDIRLSFKETRVVSGSLGAYSGRVVVCRARYVPVSGHRMSLKATREMADNERLEVWYAPVAAALLVPYRILIGTTYGDLVVVSTRFVAVDGNRSAVGD